MGKISGLFKIIESGFEASADTAKALQAAKAAERGAEVVEAASGLTKLEKAGLTFAQGAQNAISTVEKAGQTTRRVATGAKVGLGVLAAGGVYNGYQGAVSGEQSLGTGDHSNIFAAAASAPSDLGKLVATLTGQAGTGAAATADGEQSVGHVAAAATGAQPSNGGLDILGGIKDIAGQFFSNGEVSSLIVPVALLAVGASKLGIGRGVFGIAKLVGAAAVGFLGYSLANQGGGLDGLAKSFGLGGQEPGTQAAVGTDARELADTAGVSDGADAPYAAGDAAYAM